MSRPVGRYRPIPSVRAIAVLARAQQDAVWNRSQLSNQLRFVLREYFPAGIEAFKLALRGKTPVTKWFASTPTK
jgi:hypothetical protein